MKLFKINDCDWWMAPTLEEAVEDAKGYYGDHPDMWEDARELTDKEMDSTIYSDYETDPPNTRTFREELNLRIAAGAKIELFATTEL